MKAERIVALILAAIMSIQSMGILPVYAQEENYEIVIEEPEEDGDSEEESDLEGIEDSEDSDTSEEAEDELPEEDRAESSEEGEDEVLDESDLEERPQIDLAEIQLSETNAVYKNFTLDTTELSTEAAALARSGGSYSGLSEEEKEILLLEISARPDTMGELERYGFDIAESVSKARLMQMLNISVKSVLALIENQNGEGNAYEQTLRLRDLMADSYVMFSNEELLIQLLIEGYTTDDLISAVTMALVLDLDIEEVISNETYQYDDLDIPEFTAETVIPEREKDLEEENAIDSDGNEENEEPDEDFTLDEDKDADEFEEEEILEEETAETGNESLESYRLFSGIGHSSDILSMEEKTEENIDDEEPKEDKDELEEDHEEEKEEADSESEEDVKEPEESDTGEEVPKELQEKEVYEELDQPPFSLSEEDIDLILMIGADYSTDPQVLLDFMVENELDVNQLLELLYTVKSMLKLYRSYDIMPFAMDDDFTSREYPSAPFNYSSNHSEIINVNTGSLTYRENIVSLAGRGGMDLNLSLIYDSAMSSDDIYFGERDHIRITHFDEDDNYKLKVSLYGTKHMYVNRNYGSKLSNSDYKTRYIAAGWRLNTTAIVKSENLYASDKYLKLANGGSYYIEEDMSLKNYELEDIKLTKGDNGTYPDSYYVISYANGEKEYLNIAGNLVARRDKFGNEITYVDKSDGELEITDTMGRKITITFGNEMKVTLPDKSTVTYETPYVKYSIHNNLYRQLTKKTDQMGNETVFNYEIKEGEFDFFHHDVKEKYIFDSMVYNRLNMLKWRGERNGFVDTPGSLLFYVWDEHFGMYETSYYLDYYTYNAHAEYYTNVNTINYHLLTKITYPTGMSANYSYFDMPGKTGVGYAQYYAVERRWDTIAGSGEKLNEVEYGYGANTGSEHMRRYNYTGYFLGENPLEEYGEFTYNVYEEKPGYGYTRYEFNEKHLKLQEIYTGEDGYRSAVTYTYNTHNLPEKIVKAVTSGGKTMVMTELYEYDKYGNITSHWNPQANGSKDNEYRTTYTYDASYNMPLSKTYKQNGSTTVKEEYTLTGNRKSVSSAKVYANNTLAKRIDYTYDTYGNIKTTKSYIDSSSSVSSTTSYQSGVYPTDITTAGVTVKFTYDTMGNILTATDGNGNITKFTYDKRNRQTSVGNPDGSKTETSYDDKKNTLLMTDEEGYRTLYTYDALGRISEITDYDNKKSLGSFTYDSYGNLLTETDANGNKTTYGYDRLFRIISKSSPGYSETIEYTDVYNSSSSMVTTTIKGSGNAPDQKTAVYINKYGFTIGESGYLGSTEVKKTYTHDYLGNVLTELNPQHSKDGVKFTNKYVYDVQGNVIESTNALNYTTVYEYDFLGRQTKITDPKGNVFSYQYDSYGNITEESRPFEGSYKAVSKYRYDNNSNLLSETVQTNKPGESQRETVIEYTYDSMNRVTKAVNSGDYTEYRYDKKGNVTELITGNGTQITAYAYDRFGNTVKLTDAEGNAEKYTYDLKGNLLTKTDKKGQVITHTYDAFNRLIKTEGNSNGSKTKEFMSYSYSQNGLRLTEENESLKTINTYDSLGRLIKSEDSNGTIREYTYDLNNNRLTFTLSVKGKAVSKLSYEYDKLDRMVGVVKEGKEIASYSYDANGNRASMQYDNGVHTTYTYNDANLITEVKNSSGSEIISGYRYTYYLDGNQASKEDRKGIQTAYSYDEAGRLIEEAETQGGELLSSKVYEYDQAGNRSLMKVTEDGEISTTKYSYDLNNRLLKEESFEGATLNQSIHTYVYDANGNQTMKLTSRIESAAGGGVPRLKIQLITEEGEQENPYAYLSGELRGTYKDADSETQPGLKITVVEGRTESKTGTELYSYDVFNRLTGVQKEGMKAGYSYKADGLRIQKNVNGTVTNHIWDGFYMAADTGEDYETVSVNVRGLNLICNEDQGYYIYNAHGDVVELTDETGTVIKEYVYDAFGVEKDLDESDENLFRYSGEYFDQETGNIYLRARYYNPKTGRFITEDPIRDGLNWYTYCNGNPVNFIDPTGHAKAKQVMEYRFADSSRGTMNIDKNYEGLLRAFENLIYAQKNYQNNPDYYHKMANDSRDIISAFIIGDAKVTYNVLIGEITGAYARQYGNTLYKSEKAFELAISYAKTSNQAVENVKGVASEVVEVYGPAAVFMGLDMGIGFISGELNLTNKTTPAFWKAYNRLGDKLKAVADAKFELFKSNPNHPGLNFEKLKGFENLYSVRINDQYRAIGELKDGAMYWNNIIPHTYNSLNR